MNTDEYLNNLFSDARHADPIIGAHEIHQQLESLAAKKVRSNSFKPLKIIMMTTSLFAVGTLYLLLSGPKIQQIAPPNHNKVANQISNYSDLHDMPKSSALTPTLVKQSEKLNPLQPTNHPNAVTKKLVPVLSQNNLMTSAFNKDLPEIQLTPATINNTANVAGGKGMVNTLKNIKVIELAPEELEKLGIRIVNKSILVTDPPLTVGKEPMVTTYNKKGTSFNVILKEIRMIDSANRKSGSRTIQFNNGVPNQMDLDSNKRMIKRDVKIEMNAGPDQAIAFQKNKNTPAFPPFSVITDDLGQMWRAYRMEEKMNGEEIDLNPQNRSKQELDAQMNKLTALRLEEKAKLMNKISGFVPILIRSGDVNEPGDKEKKYWRADIIVWYEPTEALFNALPPRIADELRAEYQNVFVKNDPASSSCKYYEACKNIPGQIESLLLYPNPTEDLMQIEFNAGDQRIVNAGIYTINGELVKSVFKDQTVEKGILTQSVHLNDLPQGIYLFVMESNKGEVITRRIIRK